VLQFLEDALGRKLQNPSALAHSLESIVIFPGTLGFTGLGRLSRNLWGNRCGIFTFKSFRVLVWTGGQGGKISRHLCRTTYRLIPLGLLLEILQSLFDLLLHRGQCSSVCRIHFLLRILRLGVVHGGFKVGDRAYEEWRDGFSNVLLPLDHPQEFIEF